MGVSERRDSIRCSDKRLVKVTFGGEGGKPGRVLNKGKTYVMYVVGNGRDRLLTLLVGMKWRRGEEGLQVFHLSEL